MSWSWKGKSICDNCEKYPCTDDETKLMLRCPAFSPKPKPMTHYDEIKAMSVEELAEWMCQTQFREGDFCPPEHGWQYCTMEDGCRKCWISWLKSPVEK